MRKRKRDWPIRVYKFWARPLELPRSVWDTAEAMRNLWNSLVRLYDDAQFASETLPEADIAEIRKNTELGARALVANSGLNWECGPEVLDRFRAARTGTIRALRLGQPVTNAGFPRLHKVLEGVAIPHRYTSGGTSVVSLYSNRARRFSLVPVDQRAYSGKTRNHTRQRATTGTFQVGDETIRFRTVLHRQLPAGAVVKKVMWLGHKHPTRGWQWSIAITVEQLPTLPACSARYAALDFGWRLMEGYVRIGMVYDGRRFYELRCPLDMPSYRTRRHGLPSSYTALMDVDREIAENIERTKTALAALLPSEVHEEISWVTNPVAFQRMKQGGLERLVAHFRVRQDRYGFAINNLLVAWEIENSRQCSIRMALLDRLVAHRRWLYRNLAGWLTQHFTVIARKSPIGIKQMLEDSQPGILGKYALHAARRYHQWTAVSELIAYLDEAAAKNGCTVMAVDPSYTTRRCADCGELFVQNAAALVLSCPNGHVSDQDKNATRNIFAEMMTDRKDDERLQAVGEQSIGAVPDLLRSVVIEVLPE